MRAERAGALSAAILVMATTGATALAQAESPGGFREPDHEGPFRVEMKRVIEGYRFDLRWREGPGGRDGGRFRLSDVHTPSLYTDQECEKTPAERARQFVREFVRGRQLRVRNVRKGRDSRTWVGRLEANGEDLSQALLAAGLAVPYHDSWRNPEMRRWVCSEEAP